MSNRCVTGRKRNVLVSGVAGSRGSKGLSRPLSLSPSPVPSHLCPCESAPRSPCADRLLPRASRPATCRSQASFTLCTAQPDRASTRRPGKALTGQPRGSCGGLGHSGWPGLGRGPPCAQSEALSPCGSSGAHQNHSDRVQRADPPKSEGSGCPHQKRERDAGQTETRGIATLPHGAVGSPKWQRAYEHALSP